MRFSKTFNCTLSTLLTQVLQGGRGGNSNKINVTNSDNQPGGNVSRNEFRSLVNRVVGVDARIRTNSLRIYNVSTNVPDKNHGGELELWKNLLIHGLGANEKDANKMCRRVHSFNRQENGRCLVINFNNAYDKAFVWNSKSKFAQYVNPYYGDGRQTTKESRVAIAQDLTPESRAARQAAVQIRNKIHGTLPAWKSADPNILPLNGAKILVNNTVLTVAEAEHLLNNNLFPLPGQPMPPIASTSGSNSVGVKRIGTSPSTGLDSKRGRSF